MSKIDNSGLDHYGAEPFAQRQSGTAGTEGVKNSFTITLRPVYTSNAKAEKSETHGTGQYYDDTTHQC